MMMMRQQQQMMMMNAMRQNGVQPGTTPTPQQQQQLFASLQEQIMSMMEDPSQRDRMQAMAKERSEYYKRMYGREVSEEEMVRIAQQKMAQSQTMIRQAGLNEADVMRKAMQQLQTMGLGPGPEGFPGQGHGHADGGDHGHSHASPSSFGTVAQQPTGHGHSTTATRGASSCWRAAGGALSKTSSTTTSSRV